MNTDKEICSKYSCCIGDLYITEKDGFITGIAFEKKTENVVWGESRLIETVCTQFDEYFSGKRSRFDFPLIISGSEFQRTVYKELLKIPYGCTRSYSDIAEGIGKPKAVRAVGGANNKNPVVIAIPCHRVIGKDGSLTGYGGGIDVKRRLLEIEGRFLEQCH